MDLAQKSVRELYQLSHFTGVLIDGLRDVDDTDELRCELDSFRASIDLEMSQKLRM
jgi:hypothetical protein